MSLASTWDVFPAVGAESDDDESVFVVCCHGDEDDVYELAIGCGVGMGLALRIVGDLSYDRSECCIKGEDAK